MEERKMSIEEYIEKADALHENIAKNLYEMNMFLFEIACVYREVLIDLLVEAKKSTAEEAEKMLSNKIRNWKKILREKSKDNMSKDALKEIKTTEDFLDFFGSNSA